MVLQYLALLSMVVSTIASHCKHGSHCADCNPSTGYCNTKCDNGYFDLKCSSRCSRGCRNNVCELSPTGIENCTEGCKNGYYGRKCSIPCDPPDKYCRRCPNQCDGEYCQTGFSCVTGCKDSYYGIDCYSCSSTCKVCNRNTGVCEECLPQYGGVHCNQSCEECVGSCLNGCEEGCRSGFYGDFCNDRCSPNCKDNCNQTTGECTFGCIEGWYGPKCTYKCSSGCLRPECDVNGACTSGCKRGYFHKNCQQCSQHCANRLCHDTDGTCFGCTNGFYGQYCNKTCETCYAGVCNQSTGNCVKGCLRYYTFKGCNNNCTSNCSLATCNSLDICERNREETTKELSKEISTKITNRQTKSGSFPLYVLIAGGILITAILVLTVSVICHLKRRKAVTNDVTLRERVSDEHQEVSVANPVLPNPYWEINENEIDLGIPVLADCFQEIETSDGEDNVAETPANYAHLLHNCSAAPVEINYLTPDDSLY